MFETGGALTTAARRGSALWIVLVAGLSAAPLGSAETKVQFDLLVGRPVRLPVPGYLRHAVTADGQDLLEVKRESKDAVRVTGLKPGRTTLILWGTPDVFHYDLTIRTQAGAEAPGAEAATALPASLAETIQKAIGLPGVQVRVENGQVLLEGVVKSELERERAQRVAELWSSSPPVNRLQVGAIVPVTPDKGQEAPPLVKLPEGSALGREVLKQLGAEDVTPLRIVQGLSQIIASTKDDILKVAVADETVAEPVPINAREVMFIGKKVGLTTAGIWERQKPKDVLGKRRDFLVEVVPMPTLPPRVEEKPTPPTAPGSQPQPKPDPAVLARQIEAVIDNPSVTVVVIPQEGKESAVLLRGVVDSEEEVKNVGEIAALFAATVLNQVVKAEVPEKKAEARTLTENEKKVTEDIRKITGQPDLEAVFVSGGAAGGTGGGQKLVIWGKVKDQRTADEAREVARLYADNVVSLLDVEGGNQVQQVVTEIKVVEINRSALKNLGISWRGNDEGTATWGERNGAVGARFERVSALQAQLRALEQEGASRTLSQPNISVLETIQGSIVIGGQIPIPVVLPGTTTATGGGGGAGGGTTTTTGTAATVYFQPYGIILQVKPEASSAADIVMPITTTVSEPDFGNATQFQGTTVPGFKTRSASATVVVKEGETIVIGGLISDTFRKNVSKIPFLSRIPVLGELFKSRSYQKGQTELVLFLTPRVQNVAVTREMEEIIERLRQKGELLPQGGVGGIGGGIGGAGGAGGAGGGMGGGGGGMGGGAY